MSNNSNLSVAAGGLVVVPVTIELSIPVGYVFDRYDYPKQHEKFLDYDKTTNTVRVLTAETDFRTAKHMIVRLVWQPPGYLLESSCKSVRRVLGEWCAYDKNNVMAVNLTYFNFPFNPPCGPEVPDDETTFTWA